MSAAPPESPAPDSASASPDVPPPFLGRWSRVYTLVLVSQALLVILLWLFGELAS